MAINRLFSNVGVETRTVSRDALKLSPVDLFENLLNYRYVFLSVFGAVLGLALAYAVLSTPVYSADALIQVEENKASALGSLSQVSKALDIQESPVLGEMDIVRSRAVLTQAMNVTVAQAQVSVKNSIPLLGRALGSILPKRPDGLVKPLFDAPFFAWGGEDVQFKTFDVPRDQLGARFEFDALAGGKWSLKDSDGTQILTGVVGTPSVQDGYSVDVSKIIGRPGTVFQVKRFATQARLEDILKKFTVAETKRQSGIMQLTFEDANPIFAARLVNAVAEAYLDTTARRRSAESERSLDFLNKQLPDVRARVQAAEQALNDFRNQQRTIDVQGEVRSLLDQSALVEKSRMEAQLAYQDLLSKFEPGQPQLQAAENKFKTLDAQSKALQDKAGQLPALQQQYLRLARDVDVSNQLYVGLMNNAQQLQIAEAGTVGNASLVDAAVVTDKPVRPKRSLVVLLGGLVGLVVAFVTTQVVALFSGSIRDPRRLEQMVGIQTLGVLPVSPDQLEANTRKTPVFMVSQERSDTPLVEAMATLAQSLQYALAAKHDAKVIMVTSAVPGQGKSMIAANLAYLFAEKGFKTLLLDADMRQSTMHRYIDVPRSDGLSQVLSGSVNPGSAITHSSKNLDAMAAGKHVRNVRQLFGVEKLEPLLRTLRGEYEMIIIDSPPVLPVADTQALSKHADVTLFVARHATVSYAEVVEAVDRLSKVGTEVDGLVLNGFEPSPLRYGYYSNSYNNYGKYTSETSAET